MAGIPPCRPQGWWPSPGTNMVSRCRFPRGTHPPRPSPALLRAGTPSLLPQRCVGPFVPSSSERFGFMAPSPFLWLLLGLHFHLQAQQSTVGARRPLARHRGSPATLEQAAEGKKEGLQLSAAPPALLLLLLPPGPGPCSLSPTCPACFPWCVRVSPRHVLLPLALSQALLHFNFQELFARHQNCALCSHYIFKK